MEFSMSGLRADNLQGWLAAVGVMYILHRTEHDVLLHWQDSRPVLSGVDQNQTIAALEKYYQQGSDILDNLPAGINGNKPQLDQTAGRVSFAGVIEQMINSDVTQAQITAALTSHWKNNDPITSLGWDTRSVKRAATIAGDKEPASAPHSGVLVGQWLAAESLPITGVGEGARRAYRWVTWSVPLDMGGVKAVVFSISCHWGGTLYESRVGRNGQMGYFEPARTLSGG